jgi:hypothetical protein
MQATKKKHKIACYKFKMQDNTKKQKKKKNIMNKKTKNYEKKQRN